VNLTRKALLAAASVALIAGLSACTSDADVASRNLSTAADNFEVERLIVGINGITDEVLFSVQGRCSITRDGDLVVICKEGPNAYKKHMLGLSQNVTFVSTQLNAVDVDVYRTRIILKPTNIVPDFDMSVGKQ
jgi:hypothetical protein